MVAAQTIATISIRVPDPVWDLVCRAACAHLLDGWRGRTSWFTRWMELSPCVLFCWPSGTCFDDKGFSRSLNLKGRHARGYGSRTADVACGVQSCSRSLRLGSSRVSSCGSCKVCMASGSAAQAGGRRCAASAERLLSSHADSALVYFLNASTSECGTRAHTRSERKQRGTKRQRLVTYGSTVSPDRPSRRVSPLSGCRGVRATRHLPRGSEWTDDSVESLGVIVVTPLSSTAHKDKHH